MFPRFPYLSWRAFSHAKKNEQPIGKRAKIQGAPLLPSGGMMLTIPKRRVAGQRQKITYAAGVRDLACCTTVLRFTAQRRMFA
jgi:hypothetical protein